MNVRDRIKEFRRIPSKNILPNPRNWREHPEKQRDALRGVLAEVGIADAVLVRQVKRGKYELIDGHCRTELLQGAEIPALVLDVTEEEASKLLATLDPLAGMATTNAAKLDELLSSVSTSNEALNGLFDQMRSFQQEIAGEKVGGEEHKEVAIPAAWSVIVECASEGDQQHVFEAMQAEGRKCRLLTL